MGRPCHFIEPTLPSDEPLKRIIMVALLYLEKAISRVLFEPFATHGDSRRRLILGYNTYEG